MNRLISASGAAIAAIAIAGTIFLGAGDSLAQDAGHSESGIVAVPNMKVPPANVTGCWSGGILNDTAFGDGDAFLMFTQNKSGSGLVKKGSRFDWEWPASGAFAFSPINGTVKGNALKFHGNASHCPVNFVGVINNAGNEITGSYKFMGQCAKQGFGSGQFDVTPTSC